MIRIGNLVELTQQITEAEERERFAAEVKAAELEAAIRIREINQQAEIAKLKGQLRSLKQPSLPASEE